MLLKTEPDKKRWTWKRWTFIAMVAVSFVYLCIVFAGFLRDADTTFAAATQLNNSTLSSMIVHRRPFTPPPDTLIAVPYTHFMERVLRGLDTMSPVSKNYDWNRRQLLADLFNSSSISIEEYRWMRKQTIRTLRLGVQEGRYVTKGTPGHIHLWLMESEVPERVSHADSLNIERLRMAAPFLIRCASPLVNNTDSEALK